MDLYLFIIFDAIFSVWDPTEGRAAVPGYQLVF